MAMNSRRQFVKQSAGIVSLAAAAAPILSRVYAAGSDTLRVGLVGCGGRGTAAAVNALMADPNVKLVAMGDLFPEYLKNSLTSLCANKDVAAKVDVPADRQFVGFDAYKQVIDSVDIVLLTTTPHYRPIHLKYAVEKGVHSFNEKPVATDPVMLRDIYATCQAARGKNISIVSGLCYRYQHAKRAVMQQVHDGAIGELVSADTYFLTSALWHRGNKPQWSPMEYQNRNWYYYTWLGGDFNVEQHVHSLDKIAWALGDKYPVRATSLGGRQQRTGAKYGHIYDHFSTVYEYDNGFKLYSHCRQMAEANYNVSDHIMGTKGTAHIQDHKISDRTGKSVWSYEHPKSAKADDMYQNELDAMLAAIRSGQHINNGDYMCKSTGMAILARESAYTGRTLTWDQVWNSPLSLAPAKYEWGPAPETVVAIPGQYKLPA